MNDKEILEGIEEDGKKSKTGTLVQNVSGAVDETLNDPDDNLGGEENSDKKNKKTKKTVKSREKRIQNMFKIPEGKEHLVPECKKFIDGVKDVLHLFLPVGNLDIRPGTGMWFSPEFKVISIDINWFEKMKNSKDNYSQAQIFFALIHELGHFKDMLLDKDIDSMIKHFEHIKGKKMTWNGKRYSLAGVYHELYNCLDDVIVNSMAKNTPYFKSIGNSEIVRLYQEKLFADHKNDVVEEIKNSGLTPEEIVEKYNAEDIINYDGPVDYSKTNLSKQLLYRILRSKEVVNQEVVVSEFLQGLLDSSIYDAFRKAKKHALSLGIPAKKLPARIRRDDISFKVKLKDFFDKYLFGVDWKTGRNKMASDRYDSIVTYLEPIFDVLVQIDIKDGPPEPPKNPHAGGEGEGGGDSDDNDSSRSADISEEIDEPGEDGDEEGDESEEGEEEGDDNDDGNSNSRDSSDEKEDDAKPLPGYEDFEKTIDDMMDWLDDYKDFKDGEDAAEKKRKGIETQEDRINRVREARRRQLKAKNPNLTDAMIDEFDKLKTKLAPYVDGIGEIWEDLIKELEIQFLQQKEKWFSKGFETDINKAIQEYPQILAGADLDKDMQLDFRMETILKQQILPQLTRLRLVIDNSGSMSMNSGRLETAKSFMLILALSMIDLKQKMERFIEQLGLEDIDFNIDTQIWSFGKLGNSKLLQDFILDENGLDQTAYTAYLIEALEGVSGTEGGTHGLEVWKKINNKYVSHEEKQMMQEGKLKEIIIELTDGDTHDTDKVYDDKGKEIYDITYQVGVLKEVGCICKCIRIDNVEHERRLKRMTSLKARQEEKEKLIKEHESEEFRNIRKDDGLWAVGLEDLVNTMKTLFQEELKMKVID